MWIIDDKNIRSFTGDKVYKRAINYYKLNMIKKIYKAENEEEENIEAKVGSNTEENKEYSVKIEMKKFTGLMKVSCDCPYYTAEKGNICKHIGTVLIKCAREPESIPEKNDDTVEIFLQTLNTASKRINESKKLLNLEIRYSHMWRKYKTTSLEFKIGIDKMYIIRNIKEFIEAVANRSKYEFTVNFTYDPEIHEFKEEDKPIIEMLKEVNELDNVIQEGEYIYKDSVRLMKGKEAFLGNSQTKRFFEIMGNREFVAQMENKEYPQIKILQQDMPINFKIHQNNEYLIIDSVEEQPIPLTKDGEYIFFQDNIYYPSKAQNIIYMTYYNEIKKKYKENLVFPMAYSNKVIQNILPKLRRISENLIIDEELEKNIYEKKLESVVLLDKTKKSITADVKFTYGEYEFNPLSDNMSETRADNNKIVIRNYEKENNIIDCLKEYDFINKGNKYVFTGKEDRLYDFLFQGMEKLRENSEIYYSKEFTNIKIINPTFVKSKVSVNNEDLLEMTFDIEGVEPEDIQQILKALIEKKKYYRLKKGDVLALESENFSSVAEILEKLEVQKKNLKQQGLNINKFNAIYLESILENEKYNDVEKNNSFKELVNNFKNLHKTNFQLPTSLSKTMRDYQKDGFVWFNTLAACGFGGILADEMGLGKTLQTIAYILSNKQNNKPNIVISPSSLIYNWEAEIKKFAPELKTLVVSGSKKERLQAIEEIQGYDVIITSYPLIRRDIEKYEEISFNTCIIDEAQAIKNPLSQSSNSVKRINAKNHFALTGTPIENSLIELWSIFDFVMPGYLSTYRSFLQKYEMPIIKENDLNASKDLNKHVAPFILRRKKRDVIKELPPKIEHKVIVDMTEEQKKIYTSYLSVVKNEIREKIQEKGFKQSKLKILSVLTRLRQICCHPSLFVDNYKGKSGKLDALYEILQGAIEENHRVLIFSQFTSALKIIMEGLDKRNITYFYLDGNTPSKTRIELADKFNSGEKQVFAISLKAGGSGLNLTGADTVIHFDPWWNPAVEAQASDRAHRIGQDKSVEVIKLITRGTIEEKIYKLQQRKKELIKGVMEAEEMEQNLFKSMTEEDISKLFED